MDEEMRTIEVKKTEFCIVFWIGLLLMPISIVFWVGFLKKMDIVNFDSYTMSTEPDSINNGNAQNDNILLFNQTQFVLNYVSDSGVEEYIFAPVWYKISRSTNYLLPSLLHYILFIKKGSRSGQNSYFTRNFTLPSSYSTLAYNITWNSSRTNNQISQDFVFPIYRTLVDQNDPYIVTRERLTKIKMFRTPGVEDTPMSEEGLVVEYTDYTVTSSYNVLMEIYDSEGMVNYSFPGLEDYTIAGISIILLFIGLIMVLIFLWHWWSVKYIIIQNVIKKCTTHQRYY
ncbi:hypothetical protein TVAG_355060 [Trichomonas vaginalis G3]|uniref:Uncharacterized protein n=1 Tax=Trichomonas vaginalis (strain ATCC PRA-98 / G3) TaxID=412133 RepID=A2EFZ1_TRIV3|nr:hypothetical protein TVAGG3_0515920 [Trichomonas vaginalis G3]EAY08447.1 hypothetical protein TVAG_355060 [Trichomonas vaginalis G3]KAI5518121.1 hypothetical protein TVAGG3_0515920 [Trichomonas vaginalis G3]|eukprot:XP_001320670.1 hypothetical protein [Trichomonas vaginalis G3]